MDRPAPPPIRACLFDMDGLLIDSEDKYTACVNTVLAEHGRPALPWSIKAQLQGRPGPEAGIIFREWAQLPISEEAFLTRQAELQRQIFPSCALLPGVKQLLSTLTGAARTHNGKGKVKVALATSSHTRNYDLKTAHLADFFTVFDAENIVKGDDPRIPKGKGKPSPDIYLLALETINEGIRRRRADRQAGDGEQEEEREIKPEECLVFEDSVPGVEAGRRAGMQAVWVPLPGLLNEYKEREAEVLAGRSGMVHGAKAVAVGGTPGELGDGWGRRLPSLEAFPYADYGIRA